MTMYQRFMAAAVLVMLEPATAFLPQTRMVPQQATQIRMMDPAFLMDTASTFATNPSTMMDAATSSMMIQTETLSSSNLLAFTDQGQNLAGIFFQASLLPYLLFLYFLSFKANRISDLGNFGFQFVLLFVLSTIPSGIITKATYGLSLANVDWLHGAAESLLSIANILIVRIMHNCNIT